MADQEMVDRVAKALWDYDQSEPYIQYGYSNEILFGKQWRGMSVPWEYIIDEKLCVVSIPNEWRIKAKAAIKAMREPTEKMMNAENVHKVCFTCGGSVEGYQAMIDAVLND